MGKPKTKVVNVFTLGDIDEAIDKVEECVAEAIAASDAEERQAFGMEAQRRAREVGQRLHEAQNEIQARKDRMHSAVKELILEVFQLPVS